MSALSQKLLALLFVAGEPVSKREVESLLHVSAAQMEQLIEEARATLAESGLTVVVSPTGVEMTTAPSVAEFLTAYLSGAAAPLSRAAAEALALVAYCGPLTRFEVDSLRGVDSRRILRQLWRAGLVQRLPGRGRAAQYDITEEFLKGLNVTRREELPDFEELSSHAAMQRLLGRDTV